MFLSVSAVCAEDSASLDLNETNIDIETPVSTSTDVVADEQEVSEYSNEDVVYASEIGLNEPSSNDIDLNSFKISYSGEITDGPVKTPNAGAIYVIPTTGDDNNTGTSWSSAVKTITGALNRVADGGTIYLAEGEHTERASINKNVTLIGQSRDKTILTKSNGNVFLTMDMGLTVKIYNCSFVNNTGSNYGGAICMEGDVTIVNCSFINNSAGTGMNTGSGPAIYGGGNLTVDIVYLITTMQ